MIQPGELKIIDTGVKVIIPHGHVGKIEIHSNAAAKRVDIKAGTIDSDYRGTIKMMLFNYSEDTVHYRAEGKAIAQLVIYPINMDDCKQVNQLNTTT